ncbi:uncharacterized protein LOC144103441 [Amblyomma americanum]
MTNATMPSQLQQTDPAIAPRIVYVPVTPRSVTPFRGDGLDDVECWVQHYERVAPHNEWTPDQYLQNLYFSLDATAKYWFENHEASLTSWEICKSELVRTFANQHRQQHAEDLLHTRIQAPTESVRSFVEDVLRLSVRADPRATGEKKVRALMRGIWNDIFGGLVRNPPTTVAEFVVEATNIEHALATRTSHFRRLSALPVVSSFASSGLSGGGLADVREIIRDVVREELKRLFPAPDQPASVSIATAARDELRHALASEDVPIVAAADQPSLSYAAAVRRPPPVHRQYQAAADSGSRRHEFVPPSDACLDLEPLGRGKTDIWRTADRRLLRFHCGEPDHLYRYCAFRELGLPGFNRADPRPRHGEHPRDIQDYLRRSQSPRSASSRTFRSPSPRKPCCVFVSESLVSGSEQNFIAVPPPKMCGSSGKYRGTRDKLVRAFGYSSEHHNVELVTALQPYGKILSVSRESVPGFPTVTTGIRRIKMEMKTAVPNFLDIIDTTVQLGYEGVLRVCRRCSAQGHMGANCETAQCSRCGAYRDELCEAPCPSVARTMPLGSAESADLRPWPEVQKNLNSLQQSGSSPRRCNRQAPSARKRKPTVAGAKHRPNASGAAKRAAPSPEQALGQAASNARAEKWECEIWCSRHFLRHRLTTKSHTLTEVHDPTSGVITTAPDQVLEETQSSCNHLYMTEPCNPEALPLHSPQDEPVVDGTWITEDAALQMMKPNRIPGNDGLPHTFYKTFGHY